MSLKRYFYGCEAEQYTFYRIPKALFTNPTYWRLSSDAKILYGLMLDRMGLSLRNQWQDEENRVFIYFTLEDAQEYVYCGHTKGVALFAELEKLGLIERKKQGLGRPAKIYLLKFSAEEQSEVQTSGNEKSRLPKNGTQDFPKAEANNTEYNKTELNENNLSTVERMMDFDEDSALLRENIEYEILKEQLGTDAELLEEIVDLLEDMLVSQKDEVRIGAEYFPKEVVRNRLFKLNSEHIKYVIDCLKTNTTKVRNIRGYLQTMLYNAPVTMNSYYIAEVNHDLHGRRK